MVKKLDFPSWLLCAALAELFSCSCLFTRHQGGFALSHSQVYVLLPWHLRERLRGVVGRCGCKWVRVRGGAQPRPTQRESLDTLIQHLQLLQIPPPQSRFFFVFFLFSLFFFVLFSLFPLFSFSPLFSFFSFLYSFLFPPFLFFFFFWFVFPKNGINLLCMEANISEHYYPARSQLEAGPLASFPLCTISQQSHPELLPRCCV